MIAWTVEKDSLGRWQVVREEGGKRETRERFAFRECITAQVVAAELERAYRDGMKNSLGN